MSFSREKVAILFPHGKFAVEKHDVAVRINSLGQAVSSLPVKKGIAPLSSELKQRVQDRVAYFVQLGRTLFGIPLSMPKVGFDLRGVKAATAQCGDVNQLRFNPILLAANEADYLSDTIPHEVAHLVVMTKWGFDVRAHGPEWQSVMRQFGCVPKRTHNYDVSIARIGGSYLYKCNCKTHQLCARRHHSIQRGEKWQCLRCNTELVLANEETSDIS